MATRRKRYQEVRESIDIDDYIFEGSLGDVIERLQALQAKYDKHTRLYLDLDAGYNSIEVYLRGIRPETDKERDDRLAAARLHKKSVVKREQDAKEAEKAEFFRLHEKFGHLL